MDINPVSEKKRVFIFDNMKAVLMILVVFGHLLELIKGDTASFIYRAVYCFHMPLFIFIFGFFTKADNSKSMKKNLIVYCIWQILYLVFNGLTSGTYIVIQFTTPYWLMWFLLTMIEYMLIVPIINTDDRQKQITIIAVSVLISLLSGYDSNIGYYMSLSRTCVFLPFFVTGFYAKKYSSLIADKAMKKNIMITSLLLSAFFIGVSFWFIADGTIIEQNLYGAFSYSNQGGSVLVRLVIMLSAIGYGIILFYIMPDKQLPFITKIGANTFPVYLLHGFLVKCLGISGLVKGEGILTIAAALGIAILVTYLLGNKYVSRFMKL